MEEDKLFLTSILTHIHTLTSEFKLQTPDSNFSFPYLNVGRTLTLRLLFSLNSEGKVMKRKSEVMKPFCSSNCSFWLSWFLFRHWMIHLPIFSNLDLFKRGWGSFFRSTLITFTQLPSPTSLVWSANWSSQCHRASLKGTSVLVGARGEGPRVSPPWSVLSVRLASAIFMSSNWDFNNPSSSEVHTWNTSVVTDLVLRSSALLPVVSGSLRLWVRFTCWSYI